jgi:hypothetical protein
MNNEHMHILEMVEQGIITASQGAELLNALQENDVDEPPAIYSESPEPAASFPSSLPPPPQAESRRDIPGMKHIPPPQKPKFTRWRNWWYFPLSFGIILTIFSGWLLFLGTRNDWAGFWMACVWLPLLFGIFLTVVSWYSHGALWLHVRVNTGQDEWPRRISISMPLPLRFSAWIMRTFQDRIPGIPNMEHVPLEEIITAVQKGVKPEEPIYIDVDNGPGQERVEVYIG